MKTLTLTNFSLILVIFTMILVLLNEQQIIKNTVAEIREQNIILLTQASEPQLPDWEDSEKFQSTEILGY